MTRPTLEDLHAARERLAGVSRVTPILSSGTIGGLVGRPVLLKAENLQLTGSFKIRGRLQHDRAARRGGARARASSPRVPEITDRPSPGRRGKLGIAATIFVPQSAPMAKVEAARGYGATVVLAGEGFDEAVAAGRDHVERTGATFVHAFDDPRVIAGQGTLGLELAEQLPAGPGTVVIPVGRRRARVGHRDRAEGATTGAPARRRAGGRVRAVRRARTDRADDRRRDRRQGSGGSDLRDHSGPARRRRRCRRHSDLAGSRPDPRALEARRRGSRRRSRGGAAPGPRAGRRRGVCRARRWQHRRHHARVGDTFRSHVLGPVSRGRDPDPGSPRSAGADRRLGGRPARRTSSR